MSDPSAASADSQPTPTGSSGDTGSGANLKPDPAQKMIAEAIGASVLSWLEAQRGGVQVGMPDPDRPSPQIGAMCLNEEVWDIIMFHLDMLTLDQNVLIAFENLVRGLVDNKMVTDYSQVAFLLFAGLAEKTLGFTEIAE